LQFGQIEPWLAPFARVEFIKLIAILSVYIVVRLNFGMKSLTGAFLAMALASFSANAAHTQARLILSAETARPGDTVMAGIHLKMDPGWHIYWRNPGLSGTPTTNTWQLPKGVTAGEVLWPPPEKLPDPSFTTYIYENEVVLLVPLKLAADLPPGPLELKTKVDWQECATVCVFGKATVQATLTIGSETKPSKDAELITTWQNRLPKNGNTVAAHASWEKAATGDVRPLILEWNTSAPATEADFFPDSNSSFEVQAATEKLPSDTGKIRLRAQVKKLEGDWPKEISGLLVQKSGTERSTYEVKLPILAGGGAAIATRSSTSLWTAFLYAFLGGLILNVMPCVLPVIALKILGFVSDARSEPRHVRKLGLTYTVGVLCSFLVLAAVVVGLQAAGHAVGWGFQFANPYFLVVMTTLVTLIALNLFGVFEITLGSGAMTAATQLASKQGMAGAFFNGFLTTVLATSCTAPFLGFAVGFTPVLKSPLLTVLILLTVGAGLAAPYLVLSWQPAWLKFLPKPGPWMQRFKVAMGFPMMAAAVWLCSLARVQYGDRAWWVAMFLIFVAVAAWVYGEFVQRASNHQWVARLATVCLVVMGYGLALEKEMRWREPMRDDGTSANRSSVAPRGVTWEKWSPEAVAAARAAGRPVVVDFTATTCLTCNTIVKPSFEKESVQKKLKEIEAVTLVADYSLQPQNITDELRRFERSGVPFVLIYPRNAAEPPMTFDLVTPGKIVDALSRAVQ
jgi:thiol:disulfide interchange protein